MDLSNLDPIPVADRIPGGPTHRVKRNLPETHKNQPDDLPLRSGVIGGGEKIQRPIASPLPAASPNRTELEAAALLRLPVSRRFEGRSFRVLDGSHSYTPDWWDAESMTAVEVKAERIHSRDSRILFDAARHEWPSITWIWARKRKSGKKGLRWEIEIYRKANKHRGFL